MTQQQRRSERKAREKRNARKNIQPKAAVKRADCRKLAEQQQKQELQPAGKHIKGRDHERAQPRQAQLAQRTVGGKEQCRGDDL